MTGVRRIARWVRRRRAVRRRFNPYVVGTPVFDSTLLFGRARLTRGIIRLLSSRNVKLTGERRIGKTTFLHNLHRALVSGNGALSCFAPVFVDLEAVTAPRLFHAFMEETVEALALGPRTLAGLRFTAPHDGYRIGDLAHDVKRVVTELRERAQAPARLVFLVDEVDAVFQEPRLTRDPWLDTLLEECSEELRVVLAGANEEEVSSGEQRHGRAVLEDVVLEPLDADDARALVTGPVRGLFRYEPRAVERIVQLAHGRPYVIQKVCQHALNRMLDEGRTTVRLADVEVTLARECEPPLATCSDSGG